MKTNSLFKRLVSMLIVVLMICTLFPVSALAAGGRPSEDTPGTNYSDLQHLSVYIYCSTFDDSHRYNLIEGTYEVSEVTKNSWNQYTCTITVDSLEYIRKYSSDTEIAHELKNGEYQSKTFTLVYSDWSGWYVQGFGTKIEFDVVCKKTYTLSYDANGGKGVPKDQKQTVNVGQSVTFTVSSTKPTWENHTFLGWAEDPDAQTAQYEAGDKITVSGSKTLYAVWKDNTPTPPAAPDFDVLKGLLKVEIDCETKNNNHKDEIDYDLIEGSYDVSGVTGDPQSGYTYTVTVKSGSYIGQYNTDIGKTHKLKTGEAESKIVTLVYTDNGWKVSGHENDRDKYEIEFDVVCDGIPTPPKKPDDDTVKDLLANGAVTIDCTNSYAVGHADRTYGLLAGSYTVGSVQGNATSGYTCTVTVDPASYVAEYNKGFSGHNLSPANQGSKTITLKHNGTSWVVDSTVPVVFTVDCNTPAPAPQQPSEEYLKELLANGAVKIDCTNTKVNHADKTYGLLKGSYDIGEPQKVEGTDVYTCEITVYAAPYVAQYSDDMRKEHTLSDNSPKTITLIYNDDQGWYVGRPERATAPAFTGVTFNVVCKETPVTTYTVTYKDGVGGKVFKDDVHTVESGTTTPAFVGGIPTRPGYVFVGWTPAVSKTVTGNATYTATQRKVKDTTVIEIGGGNSSSSSSKEENPNTGAPVFVGVSVGVSVGALAAAK